MATSVLLNNVSQNAVGTFIYCQNAASCMFIVSGQFDARINFEATIDTVNWFSYAGKINNNVVSSFVTNATFVEFDTAGITAIRPRITDYRSGTITVTANVTTLLTTNQRRIIREDFAGTALNSATWQVVQVGTGQSFAVSGSNLTMQAGTTANAQTIIRSVETFHFPLRVSFIPMLSQRIINQEFILEVVDPSETHRALIRLDGTSAIIVFVETINANVSGGAISIGTANTATLAGFVEICCLQDNVLFTNDFLNNAGTRTWSVTRNQRIPDPNLPYHVQIRMRNLSVAPASNTTFTLDALIIESMTATTVEILSGSGLATAAHGITAHIPGLVTSNVQSNNTAFVETTAALGANAVFTGTTRDFSITHRTNAHRTMSVSDQAGTLFIEYSEDGAANTWAVIRQDTAPVVDADGVTQHVATLNTPACARRARVRYRNGATANTRLRINSLQVGV